jgi:M6 family metalloprotease-like protein
MPHASTHYTESLNQNQAHRDWLQEAITLADDAVDFSKVDLVVLMATPNATAIPRGPTWFGFEGEGGALIADGVEILNGMTSGADLFHWGEIWLPHVMGHSLGLADLYSTSPPTGYTRPFSLMDLTSSEAPGYLAYERWVLGWLDDNQMLCLTESKKVSLTPIELKEGLKAAIIPKSTTRAVVVQSRRALGWDSKLSRAGAVVYVVDTTIKSGNGPIQVQNEKQALILGESITVEGVTIKLTAAESGSDTVQVTFN